MAPDNTFEETGNGYRFGGYGLIVVVDQKGPGARVGVIFRLAVFHSCR
jgi:hypothetical protein